MLRDSTYRPMERLLVAGAFAGCQTLILALAGCAKSPAAPAPNGACSSPQETQVVDCGSGAGCSPLAVANDPFAPASTSGNFRGYADPSLVRDPSAPDRVWLAYSWPHVRLTTAPSGAAVQVAAVSSHLARSDDRGASFTFVRELYADEPATDPEGSGERGISSSETVSLTAMQTSGVTTWYAAHLRYFLRPLRGYNPKYATSWTVRIGAASSPEGLGDPAAEGSEAVLGVSTTATVYGASVHLDELAALPIQHCAMLNNPALLARGGTLYLLVECLAFAGTTLDFANTTAQVFATVPSGPPRSWTWRHVGKLSDARLAQELQTETLRQFDLSSTADGSLLAVVTPAHADASVQTGTVGDGCLAVELESVDPPVVKRNCTGQAVVRARITGRGVSSCAHAEGSLTGLLPHVQLPGTPWNLLVSGVQP